jgi:sigma-54 dependent transcriptional regulator, acetoin dehydrogenase operon transcriptional activator AcoR
MAKTCQNTEFCAKSPPIDAHMLNESIMDSVADGIFAVDRDRNIMALNRAGAQIVGVPRYEAIGRKCFDVLRATVCDVACPVQEAMATARPVLNRRVTILTQDGNEIPLSISAAPLRDANGRIVGGVETFRDLSGVETLRKQLAESFSFGDIVGKSAPMRRLFKILPNIAESGSTVLIEGESGTGKELFARAIHDLSTRSDKPYVIVNCGALPETLLESELFGYRKGAFTDAKKDKLGRFELAQDGSLFLDEVETLPPPIQVKLLRALENRAFEPLGGTKTVHADVRIIASSNRSLRELVDAGKFRHDLLFRLNVITLELPPLRSRRDDIPLLVDHFVRHFNIARGKEVAGVSPAVMRVLMAHDFPGNVRELQNVVEHGFALCDGFVIDVNHLPPLVAGNQTHLLSLSGSARPATQTGDARPLADAEAQAIQAALLRNQGHRTKTAEELGISTATLWRKMRRHGIRT